MAHSSSMRWSFTHELSRERILIIGPRTHDRMLIGKLKSEIHNAGPTNVYVSNRRRE